MSALLVLAAILAEPGAVAPPVVTEANWARIAPKIDVAQFVLSRARPAGRKGGSARIRCEITVDGAATACVVLSETPVDSGLGEALIALAPHLTFTPKMIDGKPVAGGSMVIPMSFGKPRP